jgi:predicted HicB family RNase H-like nuclease
MDYKSGIKTIVLSKSLHKLYAVKAASQGKTVGSFIQDCLENFYSTGLLDSDSFSLRSLSSLELDEYSWNKILQIAEKEQIKLTEVIPKLLKDELVIISSDFYQHAAVKAASEGETVGRYVQQCLDRYFQLGLDSNSYWERIQKLAEAKGIKVNQVLPWLLRNQ